MKESLKTEFKSDLKRLSDNDLVDAVVGMANTDGGDLYLGVEDDGQITGIQKVHADEIGVAALIANKTVPSVSVRAEIISEENTDVLKISIPMCRTIVATADGKILRRRLKLDGTPENIPMYPYEINTRLLLSQKIRLYTIFGRPAGFAFRRGRSVNKPKFLENIKLRRSRLD